MINIYNTILTVITTVIMGLTLLLVPSASAYANEEKVRFEIVPVLVTHDNGEANWSEAQTQEASQFAAKFWSTQSSGKLAITVRPTLTHHTKLDLRTSSSSLTNDLTVEVAGHQRKEIRNKTYIFFLPQKRVVSGTNEVAASSYNNNYPAYGFTATGGAIVLGTQILAGAEKVGPLIAHELGHSFAIGHANSFTCKTGATVEPTLTTSNQLNTPGCTINEYSDYLDIMSNVYGWGALNTGSAHNRGFSQSQEVLEVTPTLTPTTYSLKPWGERGHNKQKSLKVIPVSPTGTPTYVELRTNTGLDAGQAVGDKEGVRFLKYFNHDKTSTVMPPAAQPGNKQTWEPGKNFYPADKSYRITVLKSTRTEATVEVKLLTKVEQQSITGDQHTHKLKLTTDRPESIPYHTGETKIIATLTDAKGEPVANKKVTLINGGTIYPPRVTDKNGQGTWIFAKTWYAGTWKLTGTVEGNIAPSVEIVRTVTKTDFRLKETVNNDNSLTLTVGNKVAMLGILSIKDQNGKEVLRTSLEPNWSYKIPATSASKTRYSWSYTGDRNINDATGVFGKPVKSVPQVTGSQTPAGYVVKIAPTKHIKGNATITVGGAKYSTLALRPEGSSITIPAARMGNTTDVKITAPGSYYVGTINKSFKVKKASLSWKYEQVSKGYVIKMTSDVDPTGTVGVYVNGKLIGSPAIKKGFSYVLPANKYANNSVVKVTYAGSGLYAPYTRTVTLKKQTIAWSSSQQSKGYLIRIADKPYPNLNGSVRIHINDKLYTTRTLSKGFSYLVPGTAYKNGDKLSYSYSGNGFYMSDKTTATLKKTTPSFVQTKTSKGYLIKWKTASHNPTGVAKVYVNGVLYKKVTLTSKFSYVLPANAYKNKQVVKVVYSGNAQYSSTTRTFTVSK